MGDEFSDKTYALIFAVIIVVLLVYFKDDIMGCFSKDDEPEEESAAIPDESETVPANEYMDETDKSLTLPPGETSDMLNVLGYTANQPWEEIAKVSELDPSTFVNHREFVKDVRRFSSGANFTSVADDNNTVFATQFVGLRRPTHVPIGSTARQTPDVDETVLMRNKEFNFTGGPRFNKFY